MKIAHLPQSIYPSELNLLRTIRCSRVHYVALALYSGWIENKNIKLSNLSGVPLKASYRKLTWLAARDGGARAAAARTSPRRRGNLYLRNVTLRKKGMHAKKQLTITWTLIYESLVFIINAKQLRRACEICRFGRGVRETEIVPRYPFYHLGNRIYGSGIYLWKY